MSAAPCVESVEADSTIRLLMATVAQHRRQELLLRTMSFPLGRIRALATDSRSSQVRAQGTLLRLVSVVEAFLVSSLVVRLERHAPRPRSKVMEAIYVDAEDSAIASWAKLKIAYNRFLDINLAGSGYWGDISATNDARNAIAHGVGELTRRQTRKNLADLVRALASVGVSVDGSAIVVTNEAVYRYGKTAREFVLWVDERLRLYDAGS